MRTKEELDEYIATNPFPVNPTHEQSLDWHIKAIEFEFGKGSYIIVSSGELESAWNSGTK